MSQEVPIIAVLDIGTTKVRCLIASPTSPEEPRFKILGVAQKDNTGSRKGEITDISYVGTAARGAIQIAEKQAEVRLARVWVLTAGGRIQSSSVHGSIPVSGSVDAGAMSLAADAAQRMASNPIKDRTVIHTFLQKDYLLDQMVKTRTPEGQSASNIGTNVLVVHADAKTVTDITNVVRDTNVAPRGLLASVACADSAVLSDAQRDRGVLLIDLGGGTTSFLHYEDGALMSIGSLPVGGDHVTTDLQAAFNIKNFSSAESLKIASASATIQASSDVRTNIPDESFLAEKKTVPLNSVEVVVNARLREIFKMVQENIHGGSFQEVVLTGGGALMKNICDLASRVFGVPASVGKILDGTCLSAISDPQAAALYGALFLACGEERVRNARHAKSSQEANRKNSGLFGFF